MSRTFIITVLVLFQTHKCLGLEYFLNPSPFSIEIRGSIDKYERQRKKEYGYYLEHAFRSIAVHGSTVNRGTFAVGSTYQLRFCYDNEDKSKEDIYRVLTSNNDLMLETILSKDNKFNMGFLFSSSWSYRIQDFDYDPLIGVQIRASPEIKKNYSIMPIIGITAEIVDFYYGYSVNVSGIYSGYSVHNLGISFRFSELIHAFDSK